MSTTPNSPASPRDIETRAQLARELTRLRSQAGLTVRELARRLDTPVATIGGYFSGRHLPSTAQLDMFNAILGQCGVSESGEVAAWVDALTRVRLSSDGRVARAPSPYRGLEPFESEDAGLFFGREVVTDAVVKRLAQMRDAALSPRVLFIVGSSGSGKSSLLRAGVAPRVQDGALDSGTETWQTGIFAPGDVPSAALRECLAEMSGLGPRLIVVDQFEEVFGAPKELREEFFDELSAISGPDTLVVSGLRADFYEAALREPLLLGALQRSQVLLGPMTREEVVRAIVEPARSNDIVVADGLVDLLLADLAPRSATGFAHDPGALPLLSYALLATWERAHRNQLTIADYRSVGGLHGAISQTAEELYRELTPEEQDLTRRIFCRLVRVGDDAPLTRRKVARHELEALGATGNADTDGPSANADVLARFVAARLVTVDAEAVELSHEALLSAWPRLADWLERDRESLRMHHQITDGANEWIRAERDPALLFRGTRLQVADEWASGPDRRDELNRVEREFLDAGSALADAERRAARRRTRRTQQLLGAVTALAAIAIVLAAVAFHAQADANQARDQALSRQVAIEATDLESTQPSLAMQLALVAYRTSATIQATSALIDASSDEMPTRLLGPIGPTSVAVSRSGRLLAVAYSATNQVRVYTMSGGHPSLRAVVSAGPSSEATYAVALSPNGRYLAAGGTRKQVELWSLANPARPKTVASLGGFSSTVYGIAFSPNDTRVAAADNDGTVREWWLDGTSRPSREAVLVAPGRPSLQSVSYSPSGAALAAVGANGRLLLWRTANEPTLVTAESVGSTTLTSVAYSPNGRTLAAGGQNDDVYLWTLNGAGMPKALRPPLSGFSSWVDSLAFSPDGKYLAAGSSDNSLRVWSTGDWVQLATFDHPAPVTGCAFTPGDRYLVTVDADGTTRIWTFPPPSSVTASGNVYTVDYTANGNELAAVSGGPSGDVALWNVANPWRPSPTSTVTMPSSFGPVAGVEALSPNGKLLAVGNAAAQVQLVNLSAPSRPGLIRGILGGATPDIEQLDFSPNGHLLSVGDDAGRIHQWDVTDPAHPTALPTLDESGASSNVFGVAYSPNGKLLAAACADDKVWLWDIADPDHPKLLAKLGGFTDYAYTVAFTPDGRTLIAASADHSLRLWNVTDPGHPSELGVPLAGPTSTVYDIAVSPDGQTLAAGTTGGSVWLWNIADPLHPVAEADLSAATGEVFDVNFSPNDRTLVATGTDQTLNFVNYHPSEVAARICSLAGDPITRAEWAQYVQGAPYNPPCR